MVCWRSFSFWLKVEDEMVAVGFGFWLEVEDERVYRDCILLRIFLVFKIILCGRVVDDGLLKLMFGCGYGCSMILGKCLVVGIDVCGCLWVEIIYTYVVR